PPSMRLSSGSWDLLREAARCGGTPGGLTAQAGFDPATTVRGSRESGWLGSAPGGQRPQRHGPEPRSAGERPKTYDRVQSVVRAAPLVEPFGTGRGYAAALVVWSLAAAGHALARSPFGFGVARFLLGLGEAGNVPAAIKTTAEWFPRRERALATGIFDSGSN